MGNSLNRVLDLVGKLGYKHVVFAGCDGTPDHLGDTHQHGTTVNGKVIHPSQAYGYKIWGILFDEYVVGYLKFNQLPCYSLTPRPFNRNAKQKRASLQQGVDVDLYDFADG